MKEFSLMSVKLQLYA